MVDVNKIKDLLKTYFKIDGSYQIDPDSGVIDVDGDVKVVRQIEEIPVQFGVVTGTFICSIARLTSLKGAPHKVGKIFGCGGNLLTSLQGAPQTVGWDFFCNNNRLQNLIGSPHVGGLFVAEENPLISLEGIPENIPSIVRITYQNKLPLLRLCRYDRILIRHAPDVVLSIMKKYAGLGKPGALKAAAELIRAGYLENARW